MKSFSSYDVLPLIHPESFLSPSAIDDTEALQQAIDTAADTGAIVQLAERIYTISSTLTLYSATIIQGTIPGYQNAADTYFTGSMIKYTASTGVAMRFLCQSNAGDTAIKNNAFRFRLSNFFLKCVSSSNTDIGLLFETNDDSTAPRHGLVESVKLSGFHTNIRIKAISYVTFRNIVVNDFISVGIHIAKASSNQIIEFAYFDKVNMNTSKRLGTRGIFIESGNNLYFDGIDINDCEKGIAFELALDTFNHFLNNINLSRCIKCLFFCSTGNFYMTRLSISNVSFSYPVWNGFSTQVDKYAGIWFEQLAQTSTGIGTVCDSIFSRIFDDQGRGSDFQFFLYVQRTSESRSDVITRCTFKDMRVLNPVSYNRAPRTFGMLNAIPSGTLTLPANQTSATSDIIDRHIFPASLLPPVLISPSVSGVSASVVHVGTNTSVKVQVTSPSSSPRSFDFFIPLLY